MCETESISLGDCNLLASLTLVAVFILQSPASSYGESAVSDRAGALEYKDFSLNKKRFSLMTKLFEYIIQ